MKYRNLSDLFWKRFNKYENEVFLRYKTRIHKPLEDITWSEAGADIRKIAHGLKALGVQAGENVGLLAATCHYWLLCDMGIISRGACTVPIYHSSTAETVKYIVNHSECEIVFVRNKIQLQKLRENWDDLPKLRYAVVILDKGDLPEHDPRIITLEELCRLGYEDMKKDPDFVERKTKKTALDDPASIIYTSGTTGDPKGVILTHRNFLTAALSFYQYVPLDEGEKLISFLPLAHVFERVAGQFYGVDQGAVFTYCERPELLSELLVESGCEGMMVVPRMLEKIHARIMSNLKEQSLIKRKVFESALAVGVEYYKCKLKGKPVSKFLASQYQFLSKTILSKIKAKIAPKQKVFVVGGAPMSEELHYFFLALGFNIVEGYGLTETSAAITVNPPWANRPGTVGLPFRHFDVTLDEDGEIMVKGPAVFSGYYKNPEATEAAFKDGWFCTGDIGEFDEDGYLKITGRKKDIIITAAGKNIAPERVENFLKQSEFINQVVVLGDREKYLAAIVTLNHTEIKKYCEENEIKLKFGDLYCDSKEINRLIKHEISEHSKDLASYERIKSFHILQNELTIANGEITPTLKTRRNFIRQKYQDIIQPLFALSKKARKV